MAPSRPVSGRAVTMLRRVGVAALLLGAGLQGAAAQGYSWGYGPEEVYGAPRAVYRAEPALSPRAVAYSLQDRGFTEVGRPRFDGRAYVVDATGPRGARLRLVVDARDGAVIGREVVGEAYYPTAIRPRPVAPGYGWTEEDGRSRRIREAEALVPPADIPSAAPAPTYRGPALGEGRVRTERAPSRPSLPRQQANAADAGIAPQIAPEANPYGLNPDAARPDAARKTAKVAPAARPPVARTAPAAPAPSLRPAEAAAPRETPTAKADRTPVDTAPAKSAEPAEPTPPVKTAESSPALAPAPKDRSWQDPPADRKPVRVIGGATIVPGGSNEAGAN
ncbi:hypothetical protein [Methylorubrum salsuginis]|uniref:Peptidase propeptide and YPEB domain-containing protein n=1 Tax=Methylorubrum salsuginis TaxID=414703 RepID=A0A1I4EVB1_9HYPH|nr:hypothetical protein [Methylorubrum salsuginis]SFL08486.1 hypothetical protein SAMN04488125_108138 [Methylorubrum salsuginis]